MTALLEVENLVKSYGTLTAVNGLGFAVESGEALGLLGPNGAGKSTTMMMICGLVEPDSGQIRLNGQPLDHQRPSSRRQMGVVPQDLAIYGELTARENLMFFSRLYHLTGVRQKQQVSKALERVGLAARAGDPASTFSGGMKRRLNFAAAIMHEPALLILDEPTVGVDPQSRAHLIECVSELQKSGTAVIYASHYMEEVEAICTRAAIIDQGRMLACDAIDSLLQQIPVEIQLLIAGAVTADCLPADPAMLVERVGEETMIRIRAASDHDEAALNHSVTSLLSALEKQSIGVRSIRTQESSLERLFLQLTGRGLRD